MSTQKQSVLPPPLAEVRKQTDSAIAASVESTEQIEESRRLSKDSGSTSRRPCRRWIRTRQSQE